MDKEVTIRNRQPVTVELKLRVLRELLDTGCSVIKVADKFNVGVTSVYLWMSIFGVELPKEQEFSSMDKEKAALLKEIAELKRSLKKQELKAWEAEVDALVHKRLVEHIAKKYHIDVKKDRFSVITAAKEEEVGGKCLDVTLLCRLLSVSRSGFYKTACSFGSCGNAH